MTPIFGEETIFGKLEEKIFGKLESLLNTLWVKNFDKIALSHTVKEIQAILCFTR